MYIIFCHHIYYCFNSIGSPFVWPFRQPEKLQYWMQKGRAGLVLYEVVLSFVLWKHIVDIHTSSTAHGTSVTCVWNIVECVKRFVAHLWWEAKKIKDRILTLAYYGSFLTQKQSICTYLLTLAQVNSKRVKSWTTFAAPEIGAHSSRSSSSRKPSFLDRLADQFSSSLVA